jgi:hypothetical protein
MALVTGSSHRNYPIVVERVISIMTSRIVITRSIQP